MATNDGSNQRNDWCNESCQRGCVCQTKTVGQTEARNLQGWSCTGMCMLHQGLLTAGSDKY